jgi:septal ring factor EnvC (AmiA/AmiB activator)
MLSYLKKGLVLLCFFTALILSPSLVLAITDQECQDDLNSGRNHLEECINLWSGLVGEKRQQITSLKAELQRFDASIAITTAQIYKTVAEIDQLEKEIDVLGTKIGHLDISLDQLSEILVKRITETYKKGRLDSFALLFSSNNFSDFIGRYKYLRVIQLHDRKLMLQMESVRANYADQKTVKEEKQVELEAARKKLEAQKLVLAQQKADRQRLLAATQNDEMRYQSLIASARAELIAIKGILAGQGKEVEVRHVNEGEKIASLIAGASCNSSGTHLHFMVVQGSNPQNPFNHLSGGISVENCSGSSCGSGDGDPFNPSGSWGWPLNPPLKFSQGYGVTWAIQHTWVGTVYDFHNGIDIISDSLDVKAVKNGTLYQGIYQGGCNLTYVRVDHDDSDLDTLYLHVNY